MELPPPCKGRLHMLFLLGKRSRLHPGGEDLIEVSEDEISI